MFKRAINVNPRVFAGRLAPFPDQSVGAAIGEAMKQSVVKRAVGAPKEGLLGFPLLRKHQEIRDFDEISGVQWRLRA